VVKSIIVTKPAISPARIVGSGIFPAEFNADAGYIVHTLSLGGRACASCRANNREPIGGLDEITQVIAMSDTTIKKVEAASSPRGEMGQRYLVAGKRVSMRLWELEPGSEVKHSTSREYETVGYVISGSAKLELEGQTLLLKKGDYWLVPARATHQYTSTEHFKAIEATSPPAEVHGRDAGAP